MCVRSVVDRLVLERYRRNRIVVVVGLTKQRVTDFDKDVADSCHGRFQSGDVDRDVVLSPCIDHSAVCKEEKRTGMT